MKEEQNVLLPKRPMRELHLFAGAGGGILGGMLLGHTTVCAVEIEPYCRNVLLQRQRDGILPKFPIWDDVCTFDGNPWRGKVDVVCGVFPVKTSQQQEKELVSQENEADFGEKWPESLAKFDPNTHSWRTHQCLLFEDLTECLAIFPRWGMMHDGVLYPLEPAAHLTEENASGSLPTPRAFVSRQKKFYIRKNSQGNLEELPSYPKYQHLSGKLINPEWMEWLMGWPIGWAALKPLEMDKFQLWLQQHGESLEENK